MNAIMVTAKGQVTLKKELLRHLGIGPGDRISVNPLPDGRLELAAVRPKGRISDVFGILPNNGVQLTIAEMNEVIAQGWAGNL